MRAVGDAIHALGMYSYRSITRPFPVRRAYSALIPIHFLPA